MTLPPLKNHNSVQTLRKSCLTIFLDPGNDEPDMVEIGDENPSRPSHNMRPQGRDPWNISHLSLLN